MNLIDKEKVVAEIKRKIEAHKETLENCDSSISEMVLKGSMSAYQNLLFFLDTLEVKEVDLKVEIERLIKSYSPTHTSEGKYKVEAYKEVLDIINSNSLQSHCSDCTNDKGCINCEGGNMHEVKKKDKNQLELEL